MSASDLNRISKSIGGIEADIKNIGRTLDEMKKNGCTYGRNVNSRIGTHETQHKTVYAIILFVATIAGAVVSRIAEFFK